VTDAKLYFTALGASTPAFKQNTFGGTIGGPIWKDRTFFFCAGHVPTPDMLNEFVAGTAEGVGS